MLLSPEGCARRRKSLIASSLSFSSLPSSLLLAVVSLQIRRGRARRPPRARAPDALPRRLRPPARARELLLRKLGARGAVARASATGGPPAAARADRAARWLRTGRSKCRARAAAAASAPRRPPRNRRRAARRAETARVRARRARGPRGRRAPRAIFALVGDGESRAPEPRAPARLPLSRAPRAAARRVGEMTPTPPRLPPPTSPPPPCC